MTRYSTRPFPAYRHRPGQTPHPERDREGHAHGQPERVVKPLREENWRSHDDYLYGVDLFNAGYFWEAHAVWEDLWRLEPAQSATELFLKGLIQISAARLKEAQGVGRGAEKLIRSAVLKLESVSRRTGASTYMGVDVASAASVPTLELASI